MELWQLVKLVSERYGRRLQEHKKGARALDALTLQQFQYLQAVARLPEATVGALASYFNVTSPTATFTVKRLVQGGYLAKRPSGDDARSSVIVITEKGRRPLKVQEDAFKALSGDIARALGAKELKEYSRLTKKVCDSLAGPDVGGQVPVAGPIKEGR